MPRALHQGDRPARSTAVSLPAEKRVSAHSLALARRETALVASLFWPLLVSSAKEQNILESHFRHREPE
jgi:hypothetical protein